jgi:hypothetical protein
VLALLHRKPALLVETESLGFVSRSRSLRGWPGAHPSNGIDHKSIARTRYAVGNSRLLFAMTYAGARHNTLILGTVSDLGPVSESMNFIDHWPLKSRRPNRMYREVYGLKKILLWRDPHILYENHTGPKGMSRRQIFEIANIFCTVLRSN